MSNNPRRKLDPLLRHLSDASTPARAGTDRLTETSAPSLNVLIAFNGTRDELAALGVSVSSFDSGIATGMVNALQLNAVVADPRVESVEASRPMRPELDLSRAAIAADSPHDREGTPPQFSVQPGGQSLLRRGGSRRDGTVFTDSSGASPRCQFLCQLAIASVALESDLYPCIPSVGEVAGGGAIVLPDRHERSARSVEPCGAVYAQPGDRYCPRDRDSGVGASLSGDICRTH